MVFICNLNASCPDGEIGKRCGLRSRWSYILESSSLSIPTQKFKYSKKREVESSSLYIPNYI